MLGQRLRDVLEELGLWGDRVAGEVVEAGDHRANAHGVGAHGRLADRRLEAVVLHATSSWGIGLAKRKTSIAWSGQIIAQRLHARQYSMPSNRNRDPTHPVHALGTRFDDDVHRTGGNAQITALAALLDNADIAALGLGSGYGDLKQA